jgi:hypothetical protein
MDTTTQEPRRLRPAAVRGGAPSPRHLSQAGAGASVRDGRYRNGARDGRPELVPAAAGPSAPRGGAPGARGRNARGGSNSGRTNSGRTNSGGSNSGRSNSGGSSSRAVNSGRVNRGADSRGGGNRGADSRGGGNRGSGNRSGIGSRGPAVAGPAGTSVVGTASGTGSRPAGSRHLRVVGQHTAKAGLGQSATGVAARPSARPQPERSRTGARGSASSAAQVTAGSVRAGSTRAGSASSGPGRGEAAAPRPRPTVARAASPATALPLPRIPFILLVLALLGGGLICLLVVNTTLGATSFRISQLQSDNAKLSLQEQTLLGQVAKEQSPQGIEQRAYQLGMRTPATSNILDLRNHRFAKVPDHPGAQGVDVAAELPAGSTSAAGRRPRDHAAAHRRRTAHTARMPHVSRSHPKQANASPGGATKAGSSR